MLRSILRLILLVTLAKVHFGDGMGETRWPRFGSSLSNRRFSSTPVSSQPSSAPLPSLTTSPSARRLLPSPSKRFDGDNVQKVYPSVHEQSFTLEQSRSGRFGRVPKTTNAPIQTAQKNGPGDAFSYGSPARNTQVISVPVDENGRLLGKIPDGYTYTGQAPVEYSSGGGGNGDPMDMIDQIDAYRREEEANDPENKKINTDGEVIQQSLPGGRGDIVIKISGTNIVQKKMNKVRDLLKESITFVFENEDFKTAVMARYM